MTWYTFFKSVHVLCAVVWVGGAFATQFYARRALADADRARQASFAADVEWIGMRIFMPASLVLFLAGIGLVQNGPWSWGANWITFGVLVFAASFVTGAAFLGPESGRVGRLIAAEGPESPAATSRIRRIQLIARIELVLVLGAIWNMVVKPSGSPGWFWGALAVMAAACAWLVLASTRDAAPAAVPTAE